MAKNTIQLRRCCMVRSGDKGDAVDISVFAPTRAIYEVLRQAVTAPRVNDFFSGMAAGPTQRYEVPNLLALKFVVQGALGGGAGFRMQEVGGMVFDLRRRAWRMGADLGVNYIAMLGRCGVA